MLLPACVEEEGGGRKREVKAPAQNWIYSGGKREGGRQGQEGRKEGATLPARFNNRPRPWHTKVDLIVGFKHLKKVISNESNKGN